MFYAIIGLSLMFAIIPILWIFSTAFKTRTQVFASPPVWISIPTLANFREIFVERQFLRFLSNSLIATITSTVFSVFVGSLAAYGFARMRTRISEGLAQWILSIRMFPAVIAALPFYILWTTLGLYDSLTGLILIYTTFNLTLTIWIMRGFFEEIPVEIEESAMIDGCSKLGVFSRITLPLVTGGLFVVATFNFIMSWNEFLFAYILTSRMAKTLPVGIISFITERGVYWGEAGAAESVMIIPVMVFVMIFRKYFVRGISFGILK